MISTTAVKLFDFLFLDTSIISIYDFSTRFTNYKTIEVVSHDKKLEAKAAYGEIIIAWG